MKTIKILTLKHNGRNFKIKVYKTNSPSNYNLFASVFQIGDKIPLIGKTFKETALNNDIKLWACLALDWPDMELLLH